MPSPRPLTIPSDLAAVAQEEGRTSWLASLPATVRQLEVAWSITVGEPFEPGGRTAWVGPAIRGGERLVIKLLWRHRDAEHEADALRLWDGDGAVRLLASETAGPDTLALLLERCEPGTVLGVHPEPEQDVVIAGLLPRLWREPPPGHPFRSLQSMCDDWAGEFEEKQQRGDCPLDPGLARVGIRLFRELPSSAPRQVVLCTDLHAGNVLAAEREPWLVIDPKPYVGDPTYDAVQHLLNCDARLLSDPRGLVDRMADLLDLEAERLAQWLFARCVQESPGWPELADVARRMAPR